MSIFVGRDGSISLFRTGTLIAILGILLVVGGVAAYFLDQNSYHAPLEIETFPGAQTWGTVRETNASRRALFLASGATPEEVTAFYEEKLRAMDGNDQRCQRIPAVGEIEAAAEDSSVVPYWFVCLFQRTGLSVSQQTTVTIQPGVFNADPNLNTEGMTVIEHSQRWQP
jgi:hypothetical protein